MQNETARNAIAAAIIFAGFALVAYFMPTIMLALGDVSPWLAGVFAIGFVLAFFVLFALKGGRRREEAGTARHPAAVAVLVLTGGFVLALPWLFGPLKAISSWLAWGLVLLSVVIFFAVLWKTGDGAGDQNL